MSIGNAVGIALRLALALGCVLVPSLSLAQKAAADDQSTLRQARAAYYGLRAHGLAGFQCSITPNWRLILQPNGQSSGNIDAALKLLDRLHFTVTLADDDSVKLEHNDIPGQNQKTMDALKSIYGGMEQLTTGFFDTWKVFMLNPPLPAADSTYDLQAAGALYRLSYKEGDADIKTTMSKDFAVTDLTVTGADFTSSIRPRFDRTAEGLVLSGYDASYRSAKPEDATELQIGADYQTVSGLRLIRKLAIAGTAGGAAFPKIELTFAGCEVRKKR